MLNLEKIRVSQAVLRLIAGIDGFKGAWRALDRHTTALQSLGDVAEYGRRFRAVLEPWHDRRLDEDMIRTLAGMLAGTKGPEAYKTEENELPITKDGAEIGTLPAAPPEDAALLTGKLVQWADQSLEEEHFHPLMVIALFTAVFLQICPFKKHNERLARLLVTLLMVKTGYTYAPYASLDKIFDAQGEDYFNALKSVQDSLEAGLPDWEPWLLFFFRALQDQALQLQERLEVKTPELNKMPILSRKIMALFREHQHLKISQMIRLTGEKRSTLKLRLGELVEGGYLVRHGQARSTWYALA